MSTTHDSEDWLTRRLTDLVAEVNKWQMYVPSAEAEAEIYKVKEEISAHYLKPEDVERVKLMAKMEVLSIAADNTHPSKTLYWVKAELDEHKDQLSKLDREEEKDEDA